MHDVTILKKIDEPISINFKLLIVSTMAQKTANYLFGGTEYV